MANPSYADDANKFDLGGSRTSSSPAVIGGNGFAITRETPGRTNSTNESSQGKEVLPREKGFPIQMGSELFRLSGASIMSDAPSYFSKFFLKELQRNDEDGGGGATKTLYIDRDPSTFQDIARHLQGYHVQVRDGEHYVKLFADAQFYSLPRLIKQLFDSEIFMRIGDQDFQIPRDIFSSPGDSPNFFTLGFAVFFNSPDEVFPGLEREGLLRPPSIIPPSVQGRSATTFRDLLHLLRGYPLHIRDSEHRAELLRDCRYYHLRGLEQKIIQHSITFNVQRQKSEIALRIEDLRQSGVSFVGDATPADRSALAGWVHYTRPFADEAPGHELVVELGDESTRLDLRGGRAAFYGQAKRRITSLFQVVANKMNLPTEQPLGLMMSSGGASSQVVSPGNTPLSDGDTVKVSVEADAHVVLDGREHFVNPRRHTPFDEYGSGSGGPHDGPSPDELGALSLGHDTTDWIAAGDAGGMLPVPSVRSPSIGPPPRKRKRRGSMDEFGEWVVRRGQWRLRVQPRPEQLDGDLEGQRMEIVMHAVKLDAVSGQRGRNALRSFLTESS